MGWAVPGPVPGRDRTTIGVIELEEDGTTAQTGVPIKLNSSNDNIHLKRIHYS